MSQTVMATNSVLATRLYVPTTYTTVILSLLCQKVGIMYTHVNKLASLLLKTSLMQFQGLLIFICKAYEFPILVSYGQT